MSMREHMRQPATRTELTLLLIVCLSLAALGLIVNNAQRRSSERKFCDVVAGTVFQARNQLEAYRQNPPISDAGRAQQEQVGAALKQYLDLQGRLGCPA